MIAKRIGQARVLSLTDPAQFVRGRLADHQHYVGCHRPRCGICHPHKRCAGGERQQRERAWRRYEGIGS